MNNQLDNTIEASEDYVWLRNETDADVAVEINEHGDCAVLFQVETWWHEERKGRELTYKDLVRLEDLVRERVDKDLDPYDSIHATFSGDEMIEIEFYLGDQRGQTVGEVLELAWDFIAACADVTDPGTFGEPYAFAA